MLRLSLFRALAALAFTCAAGFASASPLYHLTLNTAGLSGTGWLDLQFNPGVAAAPALTATVSGFTGALDGAYAPMLSGDVSGALPGVVSFANGTPFNDLFQAIVLGGVVEMDLRFGDTGAALDGSVFGLALYAADQMTALGQTDPFTGSLLQFDLRGGVRTTLYDPAMVNVAQVPEPATALLLALGLLCLVIRRYSFKSH